MSPTSAEAVGCVVLCVVCVCVCVCVCVYFSVFPNSSLSVSASRWRWACLQTNLKPREDSSPNRSRRFGQDQWQVCKGQASLCIHLTAPLAPCNRAQHNSGSNRHRARHRLACHRDGQRTRVIVVPSHILHARTHTRKRTHTQARTQAHIKQCELLLLLLLRSPAIGLVKRTGSSCMSTEKVPSMRSLCGMSTAIPVPFEASA